MPFRHPIAPRNRTAHVLARAVLGTLALANLSTHAFESGSTGADGAFNPTVDTRLQLPDDGVFNFTSVNIPSGVRVSFAENTTNTPAVILATGDVSIAGTIDLNGGLAPHVGAAGNGQVADDGLPGQGGPGGYDGGVGGLTNGNRLGGDGLGPGAGKHGLDHTMSGSNIRYAGSGGSFGGSGATVEGPTSLWPKVMPGTTYGSSLLLPLIGGSGGGGGTGGNTFGGSGGGGGGGALLIAASGTVNITGAILANGGKGGNSAGGNCGTVGGGGSGGGIRIVATTIAGNGTISATGAGKAGQSCTTSGYSLATSVASGGAGRIRLEAETLQRTAVTNPNYSFGPPGELFVAGLPALRISRVAGVEAPLVPTGVADISLPSDIANPVTVEFQASGIPLGNTVRLTVTPARGSPVTVVSSALDGDAKLATASAAVDLPQGPSTLLASVTYTLIADLGMGEIFDRLAGGEPVKALRLEATTSGGTRYVLITRSGREIPVAKAWLAAG
jgi:hypothetical protein